MACVIFLDQGLNLCLLHWQADSLLLSHKENPQGSLSFFFILFTYFWLCCVFVAAWALLSFRGSRDHSSVAECGLLTVVAFAVVGHGLQGAQASVLQHVVSTVAVPGLSSTESIVVVLGVRGSKACGIFPDQGLNLCLLHWQTES